MPGKPNYEKLVQRIKQLEKAESERKQEVKALREQLLHQTTLMDASLDGIAIIDQTHKVRQANRRFAQMLGYTPEEVLSLHTWDWEATMTEAEIRYNFKDLSKTQTTFETIHRCKDGNIYNAEVTACGAKLGAESMILTITRDITKKKQGLTSIQQAKERTETIFQTIQSGLLVIDAATHRIIDANRAAEDMIGINRNTIIGRTCHQFLCPKNRDDCPSIGDRSQKTGNSESILLRSDGSQKEILKTEASVILEGRECLIESFIDISYQKQAEQLAHAHHERLKLLFSSIQDAIFVHPLEEEGFAPFAEVNDIACKRYGYSRKEFLRLTALDITKKTDGISHASSSHRKKLLYAKQLIFETIHIKRTGEEFPVEINSNIFRQFGKQMILSVVRDISERKQAEKEKESLQSQLLQAYKMEAVGRLAGGVAHDFNNMLGVIIGHSEMAIEEVDQDLPLYKKLLEIKKAGERSADLTRQLLAFARKQTISTKVIDINKTVEDMTRMLQRLIGEDIDLLWLPGENVWPVKMDPSQIDQVLANLCVNARDAIMDVGKVTIETGNAEFDNAYCTRHPGSIAGEYVFLTVSDDGCGMDDEILGKIFEPFFTTKDPGIGTGLGLSTVYGVIKQNDGFVDVHSEPGWGTTFKIYLPRFLTKADIVLEKVKDHPTERGYETILLVEDEPALLDIATKMLEKLDYKVITACTPGEAIELARKHSGEIHLLLTDVVMPEMNGRDLAKNILALYPNLRRLFMSGYTANVIAHHGVLDEGVNFIQKPFSIKELGVQVREVLCQAG
jgi:two-component system, cell cycle sensor histidine kinase and response regulator CckA